MAGVQSATITQMQSMQSNLVAQPDFEIWPKNTSNPCPYVVLSMIWAGLALITPPPIDFICALISLWYQFVSLVFC